MPSRREQFNEFRTAMNDKIVARGDRQINRFFNLDTQAYTDGALPGKTKELLGLVASMVLRCDDCITYHVLECTRGGYSDEELFEAFNVAMIVGGSIVIPHFRRAVEVLEEIRESDTTSD